MHVGWVDVLALALGLAVCIVLAFLVSPLTTQNDPDMIWEGRAAAGFAALVYVAPLWLGQAASTLFAALADGGIWPGWLWGWLVVAPLLGASPPAAAMARRSSRIFRGGAPDPDLHPSGAAVQQASNFAWADTLADLGWELRRTPPLPLAWPPTRGGAAVWFCYAERPATPETVEVAGPWARITVPDRAAVPVVERLSDAVESLGSQGIQSAEGGLKRQVLLVELRPGDPDGVLARALNDWRARNQLIAAHSTVAQHLPPVV
ncbi:MAG: hypothetical protein JWR34_2517 [Mycobacterium sp.]|nr:hypothetical protein [Mycobacterium sp.]